MTARRATLGPMVAGTWYPAEPEALLRQLERFEAEPAPPPGDTHTAPRSGGAVRALIAPHAGFVYSGAVAAAGFASVRGAAYDRVLVAGPSHYHAFEGAVLPGSADAYRTPLGDVPLDTDAIAELEGSPGMRIDRGPFEREHSLEAEIPFLQHALGPGWNLVPLLVGATCSAADARRIATSLRPVLGPRTLFVVSSDFTHYGPGFRYVPFDSDVPDSIRRLDLGAIRCILEHDAAGFSGYVGETGATICGRHPIEVLLHALDAGSRPVLAAYDTSGRMTGDWQHSVSYASIVFRDLARGA